jgi:hypothetical protein
MMEASPEVPMIFAAPADEVASDRNIHEESLGNLSVQVADSLSAIEALRPTWRDWTHNLDSDLDYYLHKLKSDSTILRPYVITICRGSIPQAMLVGQVRKRRLSTVVAFVDIYSPKARVLEVLAGGRMGRQSTAIDRLFVRQLRNCLRQEDIDSVCLQRLALESDLFHELQQVSRLMTKEPAAYSVLALTSAPGTRVRTFSGKSMREVRRKTRLLERAFPSRALFRCFSSPGELDLGLRDATAVGLTTWQHHLGYSRLNKPWTREDLAFCAQRGWLRIYVMYVDRDPVAFLIGQQYRQTFYCQSTGYRPDFRQYSVGSLLTSWALKNLASAGVEQVDLGAGDQELHRRLGCDAHEESTMYLWAPTLRGLGLNLVFAASQALRIGGRNARDILRLNWPWKVWKDFWMKRWALRVSNATLDSTLPIHPDYLSSEPSRAGFVSPASCPAGFNAAPDSELSS